MLHKYENKTMCQGATLTIDGYFLDSQPDEMILRFCEATFGKGELKKTDTGWLFVAWTAKEAIDHHATTQTK